MADSWLVKNETSAIEPVKAPFGPLPMVAVYPAGDAVAWNRTGLEFTTAPSTYSVTVWLNDPPVQEDVQGLKGLTVSTAWCHLPSLTVPEQPPKAGEFTTVLPAIPSRHVLPEGTSSDMGSPFCPEADDSRVPCPVVRNHSSAVSAPVPAKYPPGMVI